MECSSLDHCQRANMTFDIDRGRVLATNPWNDSENHSGQVMDIHRVAEDSRCMHTVRLVNDPTVGSTPSLCMVRVEGGWMRLCTKVEEPNTESRWGLAWESQQLYREV